MYQSFHSKKPSIFYSQTGAIPLLVLLAFLGFVLFIFVSATFPFKEQLLSLLYSKPSSKAAGGWVFEENFTGNPTTPSSELLPKTFDYSVTHRSSAANPDGNDASGSFGTFLMDHSDTTCAGPPSTHMLSGTTHRSNRENPDKTFFNCRDHMMGAMGQVSDFSVSSFWPLQEFEFNQLPADPVNGVLEFDVNLNNPHAKVSWEVMIVPIADLQLAAASPGVPGAEPYSGKRLIFRMTDDGKREMESSHRLTPNPVDATFTETQNWRTRFPTDPANTNRALRRKNRIELSENQIRWGITKEDGSFDYVSMTIPGLPLHRGYVVFRTLANKPADAGNPDLTTFHWDAVRFTGEKIDPYGVIESPQVINLESPSGKAIGSSATQNITVNQTLKSPFIAFQVHGYLQDQVKLKINGRREVIIKPNIIATNENPCGLSDWRTVRIPLNDDDLVIGNNSFTWSVGARPSCAPTSQPNGFSIKDFEVQFLTNKLWWDGDCGLPNTAFCDSFDVSHPGGQDGDLDERVWRFDRAGNLNGYQSPYNVRHVYTQYCNNTKVWDPNNMSNFEIQPADSVICAPNDTGDNQWNEAMNDSGGYRMKSLMARQPFNFENRTGTVVWDVDNKAKGHGWWTEIWITEDPEPGPHSPNAEAYQQEPKNAFGIRFLRDGCASNPATFNRDDVVKIAFYNVISNHVLQTSPSMSGPNPCLKTEPNKFNHYMLKLSKNSFEVWGSAFSTDGGLTFPQWQKIASADNINLPFEKGFVHWQHVHYNGCKNQASENGECLDENQTYRWDNLGFDGPSDPMPRFYTVPEANDGDSFGKEIGYYVRGNRMETTAIEKRQYDFFPLENVHIKGVTSAKLSMNFSTTTFRYRVNDSGWLTYTHPRSGTNTTSIPIPVNYLKEGHNEVALRATGTTYDGPGNWIVSNIDLALFPGDNQTNGEALPTPNPTLPPNSTPSPTSAPTNAPTPVPTPVPTGAFTVDFANAPLSTNFSGTYPQGVINWISGAWAVVNPWKGLTTRNIGLQSATVTAGSFTLLQSRTVNSIQAYNGGTVDSTVTISCSGNTTASQVVPINQLATITTSWTNPCSGNVTITSTNGWNTNFDNLSLGAILNPSSTPTPTPGTKVGDLNNDGAVNSLDFAILLSLWGGTDPKGDLNKDGTVGPADFSVLLSKWGS